MTFDGRTLCRTASQPPVAPSASLPLPKNFPTGIWVGRNQRPCTWRSEMDLQAVEWLLHERGNVNSYEAYLWARSCGPL